jgi:hypothetical protein
MLHFQLGVRRYFRLRVEYHPKASPLPVDFLGPWNPRLLNLGGGRRALD